MPLSYCWNLGNFGTLVFEWEFLFLTDRIRPPYQILPHVMTLAFDSKLDIRLFQTLALVWNFELWIPIVLSWAQEILSHGDLALPESNFCSNWVFRRTCSACENKLMNVYLMEAQFFQIVEPTCSSPDGFGVSSSGSDVPLPPRTLVEAFMAAQKGMLCQILQMQRHPRPDAAAATFPWCQSRWTKFGRSDHELHRKRSSKT
jgi:hypothetical protein